VRSPGACSRKPYAQWSTLALALLALSVSAGCNGCKEDVAATKACGHVAGSTACKACCGMRGRNVSSYFNGCTCYR
jgi:hypothetical protein